MNLILKIYAGVFLAEGSLAILGNVGMYHLRKKVIARAQSKSRHPSTLETMKHELATLEAVEHLNEKMKA